MIFFLFYSIQPAACEHGPTAFRVWCVCGSVQCGIAESARNALPDYVGCRRYRRFAMPLVMGLFFAGNVWLKSVMTGARNKRTRAAAERVVAEVRPPRAT